jgi:hypothetical protein
MYAAASLNVTSGCPSAVESDPRNVVASHGRSRHGGSAFIYPRRWASRVQSICRLLRSPFRRFGWTRESEFGKSLWSVGRPPLSTRRRRSDCSLTPHLGQRCGYELSTSKVRSSVRYLQSLRQSGFRRRDQPRVLGGRVLCSCRNFRDVKRRAAALVGVACGRSGAFRDVDLLRVEDSFVDLMCLIKARARQSE